MSDVRSIDFQSNQAMNSLRWRWVSFSIASLAFIVAGFNFLTKNWGAFYAQRWLLLASAAALYLMYVFLTSLKSNHRPGEEQIIPKLGIGSNLTLGRGVLLCGLSGFMFSPIPDGRLAWIPGALYFLAVLMDYFDGYMARRSNLTTALGENIDIQLDSHGVLIAALLAIQYGQLPYWYLLVAFARYLYLFGSWLWEKAGNQTFSLPPSVSRRWFAGLQMGFLTVLLLPIFSPPATFIAAQWFALPFLVGFTRDWLYTAGLFRRQGTFSQVRYFIIQRLPMLIRAGFLVAAASYYFYIIREDNLLLNPFSWIMLGGLITASLIAAGAAGRLSAVIGLVLLGFSQMVTPLTAIQIMLAAGYVAIIYLGTGDYSLWTPEDYIIYQHHGGLITNKMRVEST